MTSAGPPFAKTAFDDIEVLVSIPALLLKYYETEKLLVLQGDVSEKCLAWGGSLLQNENPIAYASWALTTTEMN